VRGRATFETTTPPLVTVRLTGSLSDAEFRTYLLGYESVMARGQRVVVVVDARLAAPAPASQRTMQADWLAANEQRIRAQLLGMAFVLSSPIHRAIITAVFWMRPLPCPYAIVATMHDALEWAEVTCSKHGLALPSPSTGRPAPD
jgi:hypothetical protein